MEGKVKFRFTLRVKLLILFLTVLLAANLTIGMSAYKIASKGMTESVYSNIDEISQNVVEQISGINEKHFASIRFLANLTTIKDENRSLQEKTNELKGIVKALGGNYENVAFYDANGDAITADGRIVNTKERPYWIEAMKGKDYLSIPTYSPVVDMVLQQYSVPVYNSSNTKTIGAIVLLIKGNAVLDTIQNIDLGGGMHPSVIDYAAGVNIASMSAESGEEINLDAFSDNEGLAYVFGEILKGNEGHYQYTDSTSHEQIITSYKKIPKTTWTVFSIAPYKHYFGTLSEMQLLLSIIIVVTIVLSIILISILVHYLVKPLRAVNASVGTIASGNADLSQRIPEASNDEIGDVVKGFNSFVEKLQGIVRNLQKSKENLVVVDNGLQESTQDATASITEIIANIESVNGQILNQVDAVDETAGAVNEISSNIDSLERMIESQAASVTQASAAVEEMIGNINSVNSSVGKMITSFKTLQNHSSDGFTTQNNANEKIMRIEEQSKMLQDANTAIANIAEQTNLLAMNAAIEAAHAGEAGKGFAVVADEIRKLSETSTDQSKTIGSELQKIQTTIEEVVNASNETNTVFTAIAQSISETSQIIEQIKGAMEEQQIGSKQIIEALKSMNDSTSEVHSASNEMAEGNKHILSQIQKLQQATDTIKDSITEMHIGADRINATGAALSVISGRVGDNIKQIGSEIDLFKV